MEAAQNCSERTENIFSNSTFHSADCCRHCGYIDQVGIVACYEPGEAHMRSDLVRHTSVCSAGVMPAPH